MAEVIPWKCPQCDFRVLTDSGGFRYNNETIKCKECNWVGDVAVSTTPDMKTWVKHEPVCEKCRSTNVILWDRKCPVCNIDVLKDPMITGECVD